MVIITTQQKRWMKEVRHKKFLITFLLCVIFLISLSLTDFKVDGVSVILPTQIETPDVDDLLITLETNQSTIGKGDGILTNLTLFNNGINPVSGVEVDFGFDGEYTEFTNKYPQHQEISLINSGFGSSLFIELKLNDSVDMTSFTSQSADVCLIFDASGSMGDEIDQVKQEFLTISNNLVQHIPDLRMGVMIYGCTAFGSEYPQESPENYIEFTSDFNAVDAFISKLVASGSVEPWGDALAFANTWDWSEDIPKLIIMVGDEDCDPGHLVGVGETGPYYNGTQLLNAVTNLKEKKIKINTVRTSYNTILENQFTWIAEYTGGESVNLNDIENLPDPITLPEIIESWTLELSREYFVNIYANISWTENDPMGDVDYEIQESLYIVVDLAPPFISVSSIASQSEIDFSYQFDIYVTLEDISGIMTAILYWTYDDLDQPIEPTWHFDMLIDKIDNTYLKSLTGFNIGDKLSYYVIAIDTVGNMGESNIFNETIEINPKLLGTTTPLLFMVDNSTRLIHFDLEYTNQAYLWVETTDNVVVSMISVIDFSITNVISQGDYNIYEIIQLGIEKIALVKLEGNTTTDDIELHWNDVFDLPSYQVNTHEFLLSTSDHSNNQLLSTTFTEDGTLSVRIISYDLIVHIHIFDSNWNYIDTVSPVNPVDLTQGTYYLWAERIYRDGYFGLHFGEEEYSYSDPYYTVYTPGFTTIMALISISFLGFITVCLTKRKTKRKEVT
ncbi:MAG: VWA domain-containing protein [Asgard group archaeon]|nr:VWA domain-containing protein [Asgard group archaeon]